MLSAADVVQSVSTVCRNRSVTNVVMSDVVFRQYADGITRRHFRAGIRYARAHHCGIYVCAAIRDDVLITFDRVKAPTLNHVLRFGDDRRAERLMSRMLEQGSSEITVVFLEEA